MPDAENLFRLNLIHEASGGDHKNLVNYWKELGQTKALVEEILITGIPVIKTKAGRYGGTWVCKELVFAYASWISPEFHLAVLQAFGAAAEGDGDKAVKIARTAVRVEGVAHRKVFAQQLARHGANKGDYGSQTDVIYLTLHGKPAKELKVDRGVKKSGSLRDTMTDVELQQITAAESIATLKMLMSGDKSRGDMRKAVFEAAQIVKSC